MLCNNYYLNNYLKFYDDSELSYLFKIDYSLKNYPTFNDDWLIRS